MYACINIYTHACAHTQYVYKHIRICTHMYIICVYMCACVCVYTHICIYTHIMSLRVKMYSKCKGPEVGRSLMILSNKK